MFTPRSIIITHYAWLAFVIKANIEGCNQRWSLKDVTEGSGFLGRQIRNNWLLGKSAFSKLCLPMLYLDRDFLFTVNSFLQFSISKERSFVMKASKVWLEPDAPLRPPWASGPGSSHAARARANGVLSKTTSCSPAFLGLGSLALPHMKCFHTGFCSSCPRLSLPLPGSPRNCPGSLIYCV